MPPELQVLIFIATALSGWVAWVKAVAPAFRWASSMKDRMDDTYGEAERPGVPARPGMMQRLAAHEEQLQALSQAIPSIKDAIPELRGALQEIQVRDAERAEDIRVTREAVKKISYHVQPNSGQSAYDAMGKKVDAVAAKLDAIPRVEQAQILLAGTVDQLRGGLDKVHEQIGGLVADKTAAHDEIRARLARIEAPHGEES